MEMVRSIAYEFFAGKDPSPCRCYGAHDICLNCRVCRADFPDLVFDPSMSLSRYIDHTLLKPEALSKSVEQLCKEALEYNFKAVCINPCFVSLAKSILNDSETEVCTVIGFPLGANRSEVKAYEAKDSLYTGATEIDMVINVSALKDGNIKLLTEDIAEVHKASSLGQALLKVIIETALLSDTEKVIACLAAKKAGAEYVKTSTGFSTGGATVADVRLMRAVVGTKLGVKAAGGVGDKKTALEMLHSGASRIGTSKGTQII